MWKCQTLRPNKIQQTSLQNDFRGRVESFRKKLHCHISIFADTEDKVIVQLAFIKSSFRLFQFGFLTGSFLRTEKDLVIKLHSSSLLRNKKFLLMFLPWPNASKCAIFYIYNNPKLLIPFFISCYFIFFPQ